MKWVWWSLAAVAMVLVGAAALFMWSSYAEETRLRERREASYRTALSEYTKVFRPGMTRKEVEEYLRERNRQFVQMCCMRARGFRTMDVLTKIGEKEPPFYCSAVNVYIGFEFKGPTAHGLSQPQDDDALIEVRIYRWGEGCL